MALTTTQTESIKNIIRSSLRNKFRRYSPEAAVKPFHTRLLGKDRYALFGFIHSLNTNFGTTIFEPVALALASGRFKTAQHQVQPGTNISEGARQAIQHMVDDLRAATTKPDKNREIERIRDVCRSGKTYIVKPTKVDVYLQSHNDEIYLFDLKTAKPNNGAFQEYKRTLLEWVAVILRKNPRAEVKTLIAIPYNPNEPAPYARWTLAGMLDLPEELKVAEELWDFLGGAGAYAGLLRCFEEVGIEMKDEIDAYFTKFK